MRQKAVRDNMGTPIQQQGAGNRDGAVNQMGAADNRVQVAEAAAAKVTQLNAVHQANVLVTKRNAYVAAMLHSNQTMSRDTEDQIAAQVKSVDPNIQNVYVSTNPDFVQRINTYVADVRQGKPVTGFFEEFSEMVGRIFPNAK